MKIIYRGPQDSVTVPPYGEHRKGEIKEYPDPFGKELLKTMKRQKYERVKDSAPSDKKKTVAEEKPPPVGETPEG